MNWMDFIIVIFLIGNVLEGMHKGLIFSIFNLAGFILAGYIAKLYYPIVAAFISNNPGMFTKIKNLVTERVAMLIERSSNPKDIGSILEVFELPQGAKEGIEYSSQLQAPTGDIANSAGNYITEALTTTFVNVISILIVFIIARIIITLMINVLDNVAKLPVLNQFNKSAGLVFGLIKGVLIIYLIFAIISPIISIFPDSFIALGTSNSFLGSYFYSNNIIIYYLRIYGFIS